MTEISKKGTIPITRTNADPFYLMHRAFDNALENVFNRQIMPSFISQDWENFLITPSIDVVDEKDQLKIEAEMPGMGPEDISLNINENMLTIKGEKTCAKKDKGGNYVKREISYGSYIRTISLPDNVDVSKASASFKKGMLWITLPKKSGTIQQTRKIEIKEA